MKVNAVHANSVEFTRPDGTGFTITKLKNPRVSARWGSPPTPAEMKKAHKQLFSILKK